MGSIRMLEQGIEAIRAGKHEEGARLVRIALKDQSLAPAFRAMGYIALAETKTSRTEKIQHYENALSADPQNAEANQRLAALLASSLPPMPEQTPAQPQAPIQASPPPAEPPAPTPANPMPPPQNPVMPTAQSVPPPQPVAPSIHYPATPQPAQQQPVNRFYRTVGIIDGPSGAGTAFFIKPDGLLATSRLVTGGMENVTVELDKGVHVVGRVVRSFPEFDLALVKIDTTVHNTLQFTLLTVVPDNMELSAVIHNGQTMKGRVRSTKRNLKPHWIPTTFRQLGDLGGNPILDDRNYVVGMLTRNSARTSPDLYGLHINVIRNCADQYIQEVYSDPNRAYCPSCGYLSQAVAHGAFYCETCGATLPYARSANRFPLPNSGALYNEHIYRPCTHCGSRVGYYNGACLRCGRELPR